MQSHDTIILGNGVLGLSTALMLAEQSPNLKIAIIGPDAREGGATKAAGAMLNCFAEATTSTVSNQYNRTKFSMAVRALKMWDEWIDMLNSYLPPEQHLQINPGTFVIQNSDSGKLDDANYNAMFKLLDEEKEPYEYVNPTDIPGLNPVENHRPLTAVYLPTEGSIGSDVVWQALRDILAQRENITFLNDSVTSIEVVGDAVRGVTTQSGEILQAKQLLVATGAFTQTVIDQIPGLNLIIPRMLAGVGYSIVMEQDQTNPVQHVIRTPTRAGACGLHVLPRTNNRLYLGATNNVALGPETMPSSGLIHFLIGCLSQINQNLYHSHMHNWTVGNRPAPIDTFPLIGSTSVDGLWFLTGTYRDGFHQSPLLAQHMASLLLGKEGIVDTSLFKPERQPIQIYSKEQAIEECITHFVGAFYEHESKIPAPMSMSYFQEMLAHKVASVYEELDTEYGLLPDMLFSVVLDYGERNAGDIIALRNYFKSINL